MRTRIEGFVLLDLLITTVIIGLLASILFPVFAKAREKARTAMCQSNLRQIGMALQVYAKDNYGHFPPEGSYPMALRPYLQEEGVFACPSRPLAGFGSYVYRGGYSSDDSAAAIIAYDSKVGWHGDPELGVHNAGVNALWVDGHVKWLNLSDSHREAFERGLKGIIDPPGKWTTPPSSPSQGKAPPSGGISGGMPGGPPGAAGGPPPSPGGSKGRGKAGE